MTNPGNREAGSKKRQGSNKSKEGGTKRARVRRKGRKTDGRVDEQACMSYEIKKPKYCLDKGST